MREHLVGPQGPHTVRSDPLDFGQSTESPTSMAMTEEASESGNCTPQPAASPNLEPRFQTNHCRMAGMPKKEQILPAPLTDEIIRSSMLELSEGTRRALETCYSCFQNDKFTPGDFCSFLRSISNQSSTLAKVFKGFDGSQQVRNAHASPNANKTNTVGSDEKNDSRPNLLLTSSAMPSHLSTAFHADSSVNGHNSLPAGTRPLTTSDVPLSCYDKPEEAQDMTAKLINRRRIELGAFLGTDAERRRAFLITTIQRLAAAAPAESHPRMLSALRAYNARELCPDQFYHALQSIVDDYGLVLPLEYTPEHVTRAGGPPTPGSAKRGRDAQEAQRNQAAAKERSVRAKNQPNSHPAGCPACELEIFDVAAGSGACQHCGALRANTAAAGARNSRARGATPSARASFQWASDRAPHGPASRGSSAEALPSVEDFPDTPLSSFLTAQARHATSERRNVRVKVVSHSVRHTGGGAAPRYPYHAKTLMAFHEVDGQDVAIMGMFVHEFGAEAPAPAAGRVCIECIDSVPLHSSESSDERQRLLTTIMHSYIRYVRAQGFRFVHLRVPPPSTENSHIFARRSLSVRLEATVRMGKWFHRLLDRACENGVVHSYCACPLLSQMEEFPPCLLLPVELAEEHAYSAMRATVTKELADCQSRQQETIVQRMVAPHDRFFVAELFSPDGLDPIPRLERDTTVMWKCAVTADRRSFTGFCEKQSLSFTSPVAVKQAMGPLLTAMLRTESQPRHKAAVRRADGMSAHSPHGMMAPAGELADGNAMPAWVQQEQMLMLASGASPAGALGRQNPAMHAMEMDMPCGNMWDVVMPSVGAMYHEAMDGKAGGDLCEDFGDSDIFADSFFST